jgi:CrcB protein
MHPIGFCGSLTTFSGWQLDVFNSWVNAGHYHRNGFRDVRALDRHNSCIASRSFIYQLVDGITKSVFTVVLSLASVSFGAHIAKLISPRCPALPPPGRVTRYGLTIISILSYAATFPAYFRLPATFRHQATAALMFSFPGTLTRYLLSIRLNPVLKTMPLGTFTANTLGTALLGTFHILQNTRTPVSQNACTILQGLSDGYCGCLTTVSTFAAEVGTLIERKAWLYAVVSWGTGQLLLLVILGPAFWAGHVGLQQTCRFA